MPNAEPTRDEHTKDPSSSTMAQSVPLGSQYQDKQRRALVHSQAALLSQRTKLWMKKYRTEIAASTSSLLSTSVAYPLDSVKTRVQTYKFNSLVDCVQHTYRTEGVHGFWRGVLSPLASITLVRTVSFSIYQKAKHTYDDWIYRATGRSPLAIANSKGAHPNFYTLACFGAAGATAGATITTIACPFEITKLSQQIAVLMANKNHVKDGMDEVLRRSYQDKNTFRTAQALIKNRGVRGLYAGFHLHLLRDTIGTGVYFMTYESAKQLLANARGNSPTTPQAVVVAGGLCGLVSWACIYPIDTVKSMYQRNCLTSQIDKTKKVKIQFFNRRMYRGLLVSMSRSCVVNAIFFSAFEWIKKRINKLEVADEELEYSRTPSASSGSS